MKIIEAISDAPQDYLIGEVDYSINRVFGKNNLDSKDVSEFVVDSLYEEYNEIAEVVPAVIIRFYSDGTQEIVGSSHYVVKYNGVFYDYAPSNFNEEFGLNLSDLAPVVQPAIYSEAQVGKITSSVKGYYILGERDNK